MRALNSGGVGKNCIFRPIKKSLIQHLVIENFCRSASVVCIDAGALAGGYVVASTRLVVVKDC